MKSSLSSCIIITHFIAHKVTNVSGIQDKTEENENIHKIIKKASELLFSRKALVDLY